MIKINRALFEIIIFYGNKTMNILLSINIKLRNGNSNLIAHESQYYYYYYYYLVGREYTLLLDVSLVSASIVQYFVCTTLSMFY